MCILAAALAFTAALLPGPATTGSGLFVIDEQQAQDIIAAAAPYWNDPRAWLADFPGLKRLTDDQERHVEALRTCPTVGAMGSPGTGKSIIEGCCALWRMVMRFPQSCFFGGPTEEGTAAQAWKWFAWAYNETEHRATEATGQPLLRAELLRYSYSLGPDVEHRIPKAVSHFARVKACPTGKDGETLRGQLHAAYALLVLQEVNGIDPTAVDALWQGTRAEGAAFWYSFNPFRARGQRDSALELWGKTPPAGRVHYSLLRALDWQDRHGLLPGMTDRATFDRDILPLKDTALWYPLALGQYAPESAENVVIPKDWFVKCVNCIPEPTAADKQTTIIGVDTGGGRAETGGIGLQGRVFTPVRASRETHDTIKVAVFMRDFAGYLGPQTQFVVDWIGLGGKGTGEQLHAFGFPIIVFRGGARTLTRLIAPETEVDLAKCPDVYADNATWAYLSLREAVQRTVEAIAAGRPDRYVSFPNDPVLCDNLARRFDVDAKDKRFVLESKSDSGKASPDRADMAAMAWLAATAQSVEMVQRVTFDEAISVVDLPRIAPYGGSSEDWPV